MTVTPYAETLLVKSRELIDRRDFSIAVVVAHMACEIAAERALSRDFETKGIGYLKDATLSLLNGYNLRNERFRSLFNAVTGSEIQKQSFWEAFEASAKRRNDAVHKGATVTQSDAEASHSAATALVAHLK
jgi:hypothetical protein